MTAIDPVAVFRELRKRAFANFSGRPLVVIRWPAASERSVGIDVAMKPLCSEALAESGCPAPPAIPTLCSV